ncbi:MAG: hypothetical protein ACKVX9_13060 [Blastocatellia bacterium]
MKTILSLFLLLTMAVGLAWAQKKFKPWNEWTEKDVQKMLNDSPWAQTQADANTAEMFFRPTAGGGAGTRPLDIPGSAGTDSNNRTTQGALNQTVALNYRIRLLTARPIRQAFARRAELLNPQLSEQLKAFAEQKTDQWIVVSVDFDSTDRRLSGQAMQVFGAANIGALKNLTYLEVRSGKRLFLDQYLPPGNDGMGAKFVFPRAADNEPFVTESSGYLRFYSEISKEIKLNMRFKISDMIYDGKLEY